MGNTPKPTYQPYGHWQRLPQWLRMAVMGEAPVFNLISTAGSWKGLTTEQQGSIIKDTPIQVERRKASLADAKDLVKSCLAVLAFLSAEVIFVFTVKPQGTALALALVLASVHALSVATLLRAIVPPPHTLFTSFVHPFDWAKGEQGQQWTDCAADDEVFLAHELDYLLGLNALTQFIKRCLLAAAILTAIGQAAFVTFLLVQYL